MENLRAVHERLRFLTLLAGMNTRPLGSLPWVSARIAGTWVVSSVTDRHIHDGYGMPHDQRRGPAREVQGGSLPRIQDIMGEGKANASYRQHPWALYD